MILIIFMILERFGRALIRFSTGSTYTQRQMSALRVFHGLELAVTIVWRLSLEWVYPPDLGQRWPELALWLTHRDSLN